MNIKLLATTATFPQDDWGLVGSAVLSGIIIVFLILLILVMLLYAMGAIMGGIGNKKPKAAENQPKPAPAAAPKIAEVVDEDDDDEEIIAVISAAIAAYAAADGTEYRITKISKREKGSRSGWNNAGVYDNTRPFTQGR